MSIIMTNARHMFTIFDRDSQYYMTITIGGVAMYEMTVRLNPEEVATFTKDENLAIAMAADVATRQSAYAGRTVQPSLDPS